MTCKRRRPQVNFRRNRELNRRQAALSFWPISRPWRPFCWRFSESLAIYIEGVSGGPYLRGQDQADSRAKSCKMKRTAERLTTLTRYQYVYVFDSR